MRRTIHELESRHTGSVTVTLLQSIDDLRCRGHATNFRGTQEQPSQALKSVQKLIVPKALASSRFLGPLMQILFPTFHRQTACRAKSFSVCNTTLRHPSPAPHSLLSLRRSKVQRKSVALACIENDADSSRIHCETQKLELELPLVHAIPARTTK